ncbi:type II toxin-antitoxin system HicB family antitoxin [Acidobacteria bacterium AH-259-O06]|nr:type II toxin-antitoxin system HicB family antitoxin [Acidobacteria bacterium AH-259-O06]
MERVKATSKEGKSMEGVSFTVHIFREGKTYVAYVPELDVCSCGKNPEEARKNIRDAVQGFLQTSKDLGTLDGILEEAGFQREGDDWHAPEFVALDRLSLTLK